MRPADSHHVLHPPHRARKVFCFSLAGHILAVVLPLLLGVLADWFRPQDREDLTVNLVDEPSVGPEVAPQTTRLPPSPKPPEPDVNPPPVPPTPKPPEPVVADLPSPPPPEPEIANLPAPPKPKTKTPSEPQFDLPKVVKPKPAAPPQQARKLTDSRKVAVRTGDRKDPNIPISGKETSQTYGPKSSDSPDGGKRNDERYAAMLSAFLKIRWSAYAPARAQLSENPKVTVLLTISGDGKLLDARIDKPSGNAVMDSAVKRLLEALRAQPLPRPPDGRERRSRVTFDTSG